MKDAIDYHFYTDEDGKLWQMDLATGDTAPCAIEGTSTEVTRFKYSTHIAGQVIQRIREGQTLASLAKLPEFPSTAVLYLWARKHPDFGEALTNAREDRAEYYHDKVLETVENLTERDDVPVVKEQVAAYKWAAEKGNPHRYGKANSAESVGNITIIVDTGIPDAVRVVEDESCQTEDVITMQSETYSFPDCLRAREEEILQQPTSECLEEPSTIGSNDTQSVESTMRGTTDE